MSNLINRSTSPAPEAFDPKHGLMGTEAGKPIPLIGVRAEGRLQGLIVDWKISQRYRNTEKKPLEAIYAFPMPEESTVHSLRIRIGDKVLAGRVDEREKAFETYDEAMASGNGAYLLDQEEPNHFLMSVGNLLPGQEVQVEIGFSVPAAYHGKGVRIALPTTISPRYSSARQSAEEIAEIERITPPYADAVPYGLSLTLEADLASPIRVVESPSHPIRSELDGGKARVSLSQGEVALDRDVVILFETAEPHTAVALSGSAHGHDHIVASLIPDLGGEGCDAPRNVTFLLDCSGSMAGDSIDQARRAVELCLRSLTEGDRFQIIRFGSSFERLFPEPQKLTQATLDAAIEKVRAIDANLGGTEILEALQSLFPAGSSPKGGEMLDLVLMTDGEVSFADHVLAWARENRERCRIFSFGIGAGASDHLVTGVARESRGAAEFIFPGERIENKVLRQFSRLRTPMLREITVEWGNVQVVTAPIEIPPIFDKDPLLIAARLAPGHTLPTGRTVKLSGIVGDRRVAWEAPIRPASDGASIARWWARMLIRDLDRGIEPPRRGSNQKRGQSAEKGVLDPVALSIEYGVLCAKTSFVAVEERSAAEQAKEQAELRKVPVMITKGWHGRDSIGLGAGTPTGAPGVFAAAAPLGGGMLHKLCQSVADVLPSLSMAEYCVTESRNRKSDSLSCDEDAAPMTSTKKRRGGPRQSIAPSPAAPAENANVQNDLPPYLRLLQEARVDGSFHLTDVLARIIGHPIDDLRTWAREMQIDPGQEKERETIFATVLALAWLETYAASESQAWSLVAAKSRKRLASWKPQGPGGSDPVTWLNVRIARN